MFNFRRRNETTFWEAIGDLLSTPPDQIKCQSPKPILLDLAGIERPYQWDAEVVQFSYCESVRPFSSLPCLRSLTMAGRRLKAAIASRIVDHAEALVSLRCLCRPRTSCRHRRTRQQLCRLRDDLRGIPGSAVRSCQHDLWSLHPCCLR